MHSKQMAISKASAEVSRRPSKGTAIVDKNRAKMNSMTDAQRSQYFERGMQLIYGGGTKSKVHSR
jgi:hypothetical protein